MTRLLFRRTDNPLQRGYQDGDLVAIFPDTWEFGSKETLESWVRRGNNVADWHGKLVLVDLPGSTEDFTELFDEGHIGLGKQEGENIVRRAFGTDLDALERREISFYTDADLADPTRKTAFRLGKILPKPVRRDTLRAYGFIERAGETLLPLRQSKTNTVKAVEDVQEPGA